jgi:hypothetical protein
MAIHPLDITPENEAEATAERAEVRRSRSMGMFLWFAWIIGAGGLALAFVGACLLAQGPGRLESTGDTLHSLAKLTLLTSMVLLLVGYREKFRKVEPLIEAEVVTDWQVDQAMANGWNHFSDELPTSRPAWTPPPKRHSSTNAVRSLLDALPPAAQSPAPLPPAPQLPGSPRREGSGP